MFKVMIAEDEAIERKAIRFLCNKFYKDKIEIICEAVNGSEAIEKALIYKPDIIFMDINMPIMNGLQASSEIKEKLPDTEFIILTAYGYFEYAKEAIKLGINDYLLKPSSNEEFCESLNKIFIKIENKREIASKYKELEIKQKKLIPLLEAEIINKMIYGVDDPDKEYSEYLKMLDVNNQEYTCFIVRTEHRDSLNQNILSQIKNRIYFNFSFVLGTIYSREIVFIIFDKKLQLIHDNGKFDTILTELNEYIVNNLKLNVNLGISKIYTSAKNLNDSYLEAKNSIQNENIDKDNNKSPDFYSYQKEEMFFKKIVNEDLTGALNIFEEIYSDILHNENQKKHLKEFLFILNRNIIEFWGQNLHDFNIENIESVIDELNDFNKINDYIKKIIQDIIIYISNHKKDKNTIVIDEAKDYISKNYKNNISLEEVAEYIELSPYYLSKLFKKTEKMNFKDYLIKIRMEEAKQLLRNNSLSIKEIALELGYSDPNYFSRAFKKYVGISATEYSKL